MTYHLGRDIDSVDTARTKHIPWYNKLEAGPALGKFYLDFLLWLETVKEIRRFKPDVIHGHLHEGALIGLLARPFGPQKPAVVFDVQGSLLLELDSYGWLNKMPFLRPIFGLVERVISKWADRSVGSNVNISKFLTSEMGVEPDKVCTIIDGIHMGFFEGSGRTDLKAELGIDPDRPIVLYTGALLASKGTDNFFEAIPHVRKERPDAFFLVVGYPVEHSQALVERLGVSEHCLFVGKVDYFLLPDYLKIGDVAVDPKPDAAGKPAARSSTTWAADCRWPVMTMPTTAGFWATAEPMPRTPARPDWPGPYWSFWTIPRTDAKRAKPPNAGLKRNSAGRPGAAVTKRSC